MIQPERYFGQDWVEIMFFSAGIFFILLLLLIPSIIEETPAPIIQQAPASNVTIETPEPTPTPSPTPTLSEAQYMATHGGLHMREWLTWHDENVSGYKDLTMHTTVYDWRTMPVVNWYSVSWGQYFISGAGEGRKYLFVLINTYSDDGSARTWGIQPEQYYLDINGVIYNQTTELLPQIRIQEFDEVWNLAHVENVKPYGYLRTYDESGKEIAIPLGYLKCGKSNAWDGYVPFIVPANTKPEDVKVIGEFGSLAPSTWWTLE